MTIRELLSKSFDAKSIDNIERENAGTAYDPFDFCDFWETMSFMAFEDGNLQVSCGGTCIIGFYGGRRPAYIVLDSSEHDHWAAMNLRAINEGTPKPSGMCPNKLLRFAQSG